jgi:hypothetical protein
MRIGHRMRVKRELSQSEVSDTSKINKIASPLRMNVLDAAKRKKATTVEIPLTSPNRYDLNMNRDAMRDLCTTSPQTTSTE